MSLWMESEDGSAGWVILNLKKSLQTMLQAFLPTL
ncbi:hypothetical protein PAECIP111890_01535 [Paenibacillus sp. JJ-223]|nr:hypothetical protein PAECIP111890_01535 [Paenibacillus sp. JJ-223]